MAASSVHRTADRYGLNVAACVTNDEKALVNTNEREVLIETFPGFFFFHFDAALETVQRRVSSLGSPPFCSRKLI